MVIMTYKIMMCKMDQISFFFHTIKNITFPDKISNKGILWFIINLFWCSNLLNLAF